MFNISNSNTRAKCEIYSKLTTKTSERHNWRRSGVFIVYMLTYLKPCSSVSIVNFEQVDAGWVIRLTSKIGRHF